MHIVDDEQRSDHRASPMRRSGSGLPGQERSPSYHSDRLLRARGRLVPDCERKREVVGSVHLAVNSSIGKTQGTPHKYPVECLAAFCCDFLPGRFAESGPQQLGHCRRFTLPRIQIPSQENRCGRGIASRIDNYLLYLTQPKLF